MLPPTEKIELRNLDNIEYFIQKNGQLYVNVTKLEKEDKLQPFPIWLESIQDTFIEYTRAILFYDLFKYKNSEEYSNSFYLNINEILYVDYFIATVYVYRNHTKFINKMDCLLEVIKEYIN